MGLKKMRYFFMLIAILAVSGMFAMHRLEITSEIYDSYADVASVAGIFDAGWMPAWLPKSAENIKETHDIDTNESWLMFNFSSGDTFYSSCISKLENEVILPNDLRFDRFPGFVHELYSQLNGSNELSIYACDGPKNRFLAVDKNSSTAYVWSVEIKHEIKNR